MTRHSTPTYRFEFRGGLSTLGKVERIAITIDGEQAHQIRYWLDDQQLTLGAGRPMPALVADIIDVSAAIYMADRLALREVTSDPRPPSDRWHRRIHVVVPVRHPDRWRRQDAVACLEQLLAFLSDDLWSFEFIERSCSPRPAEAQALYLRPDSRKALVALHSGGLDSLFGLADLVEIGYEATIIPVTVVTNPRVRRAAQSIVEEIRQSLAVGGPQLLPARLHIGISGIGRPRDDRESTQRARAILFLAAGISTAVIAGTDRLQVCENGVGAISLPMAADHWGARATRAMHPKTLMLLSRLVASVLDQSVLIENTGLFISKGELARGLRGGHFTAAARHTVSCDLATYEGHGEACGKCTSCILRRVALSAANLDADVDGQAVKYRTDWFNPGVTWSSENTIHLFAMRDQVERLREVTRGEGGFAALDAAFPDLFDVVTLAPTLGLTEGEVERRLLQLYETHVREFDAFSTKIDHIGWGLNAKITELIATSEKAAIG